MLRNSFAKIISKLKKRPCSAYTNRPLFRQGHSPIAKKTLAVGVVSLGVSIGYRVVKNYFNEDILIIGQGPVGLAHIIEACKHGNRQIIAITNRKEFDRNQILLINLETFNYLRELVGEEEIEEFIQQNKIGKRVDGLTTYYFIQIKNLEILLDNAVLQYKNKKVQIIFHSKNDTIFFDKSNTVLLKDEKNITQRKITFKYVITADGAHHSTVNGIAESKIHYSQTLPFHSRHAAVRYTLPANKTDLDYENFLTQGSENKSSMDEFKKLAWPLYSFPETRIFIQGHRLFIGTECPDHLHNKNKSQIKQWGELVLKSYLPAAALKELEIKSEKDISQFEIKLEEANISSLLFQNNARLFIVGDALQSSHYQTGSGVNAGLQHAKAWGELLKTKQAETDINDYLEKIDKIRAAKREKMIAFDAKRAEREIESKRNFHKRP